MSKLHQVMAVLATGGAALIAVGVALIYPPAGLIAAGIESIAGAYVVAYLAGRSG